VSLLDFLQLLLSSLQVSLCGCLLFCGHMIQHCAEPSVDRISSPVPLTDDIPLLQVKPAQMFKGILRIHHIIKDHKCRSTRFLLVSNPYLSYSTVPPKQVVQVFTCDVVGQIFDKQNPVRTGR
jgi:hypothetical protein